MKPQQPLTHLIDAARKEEILNRTAYTRSNKAFLELVGFVSRNLMPYEMAESKVFKSDILVMVGIPLSGKSSFAKRISHNHGHVIVCPDTVRIAMHGNQYIQSAEPHVWATVETMVRTLLLQGHKVIIDATNTHQAARAKWINLAISLDKTVSAYIMNTDINICLKRNIELNRLGDSIMKRMINQYENPSYSEGFDHIASSSSEYPGYGSFVRVYKVLQDQSQ